jgi:ANTAR domain/GAF domain
LPAEDLAREAAELLSIAGSSESRSLNQLVALAAREVPACSGAMAALWRDGELAVLAASHPDLAELFELEQRGSAGPWQQALATGAPVSCPDTLEERRWPEFAAVALCCGVRCSVTLVHRSAPTAVTLTLFGARPRALDAEQLSLAALLVAFGGAVMGNASVYGDVQRMALQLRESAESRALVDQAKGILMHALGCSAQDALDRMRAISQTRHIKVTEVARKIIDSQGVEAG